MPPFLYRCPNTGFHVQGYAADADEPERTDAVFVGVNLPCVRTDALFVNPKTGKTAGKSSE
jgi:hypothetical protein